MKILPKDQRPFCPVCKTRLRLHKIIGDNFEVMVWHCECLLKIENGPLIECDDYHYYINEEN